MRIAAMIVSGMMILGITRDVSAGDTAVADQSALLSAMSVEELVGQVLMPGVSGRGAASNAVLLVKKYRLGGIILFGMNIGSADELRTLCAAVQNAVPEGPGLFISTDQEGGGITRISRGVSRFPGAITFGAADDPALTEEAAYILARQMRFLGVNMNLTPVADINNNPDNPVINVRSFGSDPEKVAAQVSAYVTGLERGGCVSVAKHFPGHGDTSKDSHKTLPVVSHDLDHLRGFEFIPFRAAVRAGCSGIMSAHIAYPAITGDDLPATMQPRFMTDIIRDEFGFTGITTTDDMEMGAVAGRMQSGEAAVRAFNAGVDIILLSTTGTKVAVVRDALLAAVKSGRISRERLEQAVGRILAVKARHGILDRRMISAPDAELEPRAGELSRAVAAKALYFHAPEQAPWSAMKSALVCSDNATLNQLLAARGIPVRPKQAVLGALPADGAVWVCVTSPGDLRFIERLGALKNPRIRVLYTGNPYPLSRLRERPGILITFSALRESLDAAVAVIAGETEPALRSAIDPGLR